MIWQVVAWKNSGPRVEVSGVQGFSYGPLGTFRLFSIDVKNSGRLATVVNYLRLRAGEKDIVFFQERLLEGRWPVELPPGGVTSFKLRMSELAEICLKDGCDIMLLRPLVETGHGSFTGDFSKAFYTDLQREIESLRDLRNSSESE
ncbi:hypothetical protein WG936_05960 [Corynebacterium sp. H127]|uniref:hypothetical protein n=1 Tax=Corynebacterium sp. H127 TaxID=3133418 RepID=UPI0030951486